MSQPTDPPSHASRAEPETPKPLLILLHFLGGSARAWNEVVPHLDPHVRCIPIDLPGFGAAAQMTGYGVAEMADAVAAVVRREKPARWAIAGHSMGGKVAVVLARRAEGGEDGLQGLSHLVLLAGSPASPEPMGDERRTAMMAWFSGDEASSRAEAQNFIDQNVVGPLDPAVNARAVEDLVRVHRSAWVAWLDGGSREDWAGRVGTLHTPALVISGEADEDLGPEAQARLTADRFASVRYVTVAGAKHLLPMERAGEVAALIAEHLRPGSTVTDAPDPAVLPQGH